MQELFSVSRETCLRQANVVNTGLVLRTASLFCCWVVVGLTRMTSRSVQAWSAFTEHVRTRLSFLALCLWWINACTCAVPSAPLLRNVPWLNYENTFHSYLKMLDLNFVGKLHAFFFALIEFCSVPAMQPRQVGRVKNRATSSSPRWSVKSM